MDTNFKWNGTKAEFEQQVKEMSGNYEQLGRYFAACCDEMGVAPAEILVNLLSLSEVDEESADIRTGNIEVRVDQMHTTEREALIRIPDDADEPDELDL